MRTEFNGEQLAEWIKKYGLSPDGAAKILGVSRAQIYKLLDETHPIKAPLINQCDLIDLLDTEKRHFYICSRNGDVER